MKKIILLFLAISLCAGIIAMCPGCSTIPADPPNTAATSERLQVTQDQSSQTSPDTKSGYNVRAPKDERERFAMAFAEKLFYAVNCRDITALAELVQYVDVDADTLSPHAPKQANNESLGMLIASLCGGRVTEYGDIRYGDYITFITNAKNAVSMGIIDIDEITGNTLTAVAIGTSQDDIAAILVDVRPVSGGYTATPLYPPAPQNPRPLDMSIIFKAPHGSLVEYRDEIVTPVVVKQLGEYDVYELNDSYHGVHEDISVFCGSAIGTIDGTIIGDSSTTGGSSEGYSGCTYASNSIRYDISALAMTRNEFRPLRDTIAERTQGLVTQIGSLLDTSDMDGFVAIMQGYGKILNSSGGIASAYRGYFTQWKTSTGVHGADRIITINTIEIRGVDSVRVNFSTLLTLASGNRFTADSTLILDYVDDNWLIYDMTNELFKSDSSTWHAV